jgi:hypothetical protein
MGGIELPQLGEGLFQSSPQPSERNGLLLGDLIVENVDGSAMRAKIAGHRFIITSHGRMRDDAPYCGVFWLRRAVVNRPSGLLFAYDAELGHSGHRTQILICEAF